MTRQWSRTVFFTPSILIPFFAPYFGVLRDPLASLERSLCNDKEESCRNKQGR